MLIVFPIIPWGFLWQRPQQLFSRVAELGIPVVFLSPTADPAFKSAQPINLVSPNLFHYWCHLESAVDIHHAEVPAALSRQIRSQIIELLVRLGQPPLDIVVQHPGWTKTALALKQALGGGVLMYDCMDDFDAFSDVPPVAIKDEALLRREADLVFVSSAALERKAAPDARKVVVLPNAADFDHFGAPRSLPPGEDSRAVIGYFGSIKDWFDFGLLESLARNLPNCRFKIIGRVEVELPLSLKNLPNVEFPGESPYDRLPQELAGFAVALIPFVHNRLTAATNPVKLYEYFSAGIPVVATRLPELEPYQDACYLFADAEDAQRQIGRALAESGETRELLRTSRRAIAASNTWDHRARVLIEAYRECSFKARCPTGFGLDVLPTFAQFVASGQRELQAVARLYTDEITRLRDDFEAEIKRISLERDELLALKDKDWGAYAEQIAADYQAEIRQIVAERDRMLAEVQKGRE